MGITIKRATTENANNGFKDNWLSSKLFIKPLKLIGGKLILNLLLTKEFVWLVGNGFFSIAITFFVSRTTTSSRPIY